MSLTASEGNGADYIEWISQETPITIQTYLYHLATTQHNIHTNADQLANIVNLLHEKNKNAKFECNLLISLVALSDTDSIFI